MSGISERKRSGAIDGRTSMRKDLPITGQPWTKFTIFLRERMRVGHEEGRRTRIILPREGGREGMSKPTLSPP